MMMISAPLSSFHDYFATDSFLFQSELSSVIQTTDEHFEDFFDNYNNKNFRNNRTSTIKRPMNAFLLWARGERKRLSSDGCGVSQTSLSKLLGETWRHMPIDEKQPFLDMAETLKRQHQIDHPDYRFKPKQRSATGNKAIARKHHSPILQRQFSTMLSSSFFSQQTQQQQQQQTTSSSSSTLNATPHTIQPAVLAMCQAMIPTASSSTEHNNNDWFFKLMSKPQSVILAALPQTQTLSSSSSSAASSSSSTSSSSSSRRAVRIQIINKHDDILLPPPSLLPMTPSSFSSSSIAIDESTPTLVDYLTNTSTVFNIPNDQPELIPLLDDITAYEAMPDGSTNDLMDLDQPCDISGWIDTPLSNFGVTTGDMISTSPYPVYDFLCL